MTSPQPARALARVRPVAISLALVAGGLASFGLTTQTASAVTADQLVIVDTTNAGTQGLSGVSLLSANTDGTDSTTKPVPLPTVDAGAAKAFALSGDSNGNGALALSADSTSLSLGGYHAVPGPTGVAGVPDPKDTTAAQIQRMVARVSTTGGAAVVDTSTLLANTLSTSAPRAAVSADGLSFYVSGNGGSDSPTAGVVKAPVGGASKASITDSTQKNVRQVQIAGNQLYATSDKAGLLGFGRFAAPGLPTTSTAITQLGGPIVGSAASGTSKLVPDAILLLHTGANSNPTAIDTAYVVIDTDTGNNVAGEVRKYTSANGTAWTKQASAKTGDYPFLTGRVSGNKVQLFLTKGSGTANTVVQVDDTTPTGDFTPGAESLVATAAAGHAFRGVALPPTGWDPGTVTNAAPTVSTDNSSVGATLGDANNPTQDINLVDTDTPASDLTVTATSSNTAVLPNANITFTGSGATRTAKLVPAARGRATITFTVKDPQNNVGTTQVFYGASNAPASATGHYFYGSSDLSSAINVGDGYSLAVSSEDSTLRLYKQSTSGRAVATFDMGVAAPNGTGSGGGDLEGMARTGNTLYVIGSHGNNSSGDAKPARRVLFTATISGSGAATDVTYTGKYTGLWDALRTWDQANGNRLKLSDAQAAGVPANDPNGFNIEGLEFAPGSTSTAYLGFRSPLVTRNGKPSAVIVPVTNFDSLVGGATPVFGDPIYLDLGGRTIREIRKNSSDEYLISAQGDSPASPQWKLFAWNGRPSDAPVAVASLTDPAGSTTGSWESIVSVPHPLVSGASVSLITDSGDTTFYGDPTAATDEAKGLQKSYTDDINLATFTAYPTTPQNVTATKPTDGSIKVDWDAVAGAASYKVTVKDGATNIAGSPRTVNAPTTSTTFTGLSKKLYSVTVTAVNASGESSASDPVVTVTPEDLIANTGKPVVSGSPTVGQTLSTSDGAWTPAGLDFSYQWKAAGTSISGATSSSVTLGADQVGKVITVEVTATKTGSGSTPVTATSTPTSAVAPGTITNTALPTITGAAQEGKTLTATDGSWTPGGTTYTYQWSAGGTPIGGATGQTFDVTTAQVGATITVEVTAAKAGYNSLKRTSVPTAAVDPAAVTNTVAPSIPATAAVGQQITVNKGTWAPAAGVTFTYQWLADGTAIDRTDARSASFTPTVAEFGAKISVLVTGSKPGLTSAEATSNETTAVANAIVSNTVPVISGTEREGQTLSTTDGTWTPTPTGFTYVWKSDGNVIADQGDSTLVLTSAEVGSRITVQVTGSKTGFSPAVATSLPTGTVDPAAVSNVTPPSIPGAPVVGTQLNADHGTWQPVSGLSYAYQWRADGAAISGATSQTFTPTADQSGKKLSVTVTTSKPGLTSLAVTSAETPVVTGVTPVFGTPTNLVKTASTASTITVTWTKSTDATRYRLYYGIGSGTRTKVEVGNVNTATFTGLKPGTTYSIDISAFNAKGTQTAYSRPRLDASTSVLTAPDDVAFSVRASTSITVTWTKVPGVKNYRVTTGTGTAKRTTLDVGDVDNATITGLKRGQEYTIDVASLSLDKKVASPASPRMTVSTSALLPPTKLTVKSVTATSFTVTWTKAEGAATYRLYYGIGSGTRTRVELDDVGTATVTGLTKGKKYAIDVASVEPDGVGRSSYTPRVTATTK